MQSLDCEVGQHISLNGVYGVIQARRLHTGSDEGTGYTYEIMLETGEKTIHNMFMCDTMFRIEKQIPKYKVEDIVIQCRGIFADHKEKKVIKVEEREFIYYYTLEDNINMLIPEYLLSF